MLGGMEVDGREGLFEIFSKAVDRGIKLKPGVWGDFLVIRLIFLLRFLGC